MKIYLSGPIQYADNAFTWREKMDDFFERMGHEAIMPWELAHQERKIKTRFERICKNSKRDDFLDEVRKFMRSNIIKFDIEKLVNCDAILFWHPRDVKTAGSFGEVTLAYYFREYLGKEFKIWVITDYRKNELSYWTVGCSDKVFQSFEDFEEYFEKKYKVKDEEVKEEIKKDETKQ